MREIQSLIRKMLRNHEQHKKYIAVLMSLSMLVLFLVPLGLIMPAISMTENNSGEEPVALSLMNERSAGRIPSGAYNFEARITGIGFSANEGGPFNSEYDAGEADSASVWFQVSYDFQDTGDFSAGQPYMYLTLPKDQIAILNEDPDKTLSEPSEGWAEYKREHGLQANYPPGTYTVYPTDNDESGLVVVNFSEHYINYIISNGNFQGALTFQGSVNRSGTQSGDTEIKLGGATATVKFNDRNPSVQKTGSVDASRVDKNGVPYIHWYITVSDLYELNNYSISDTKTGEIISGTFVSTPDVFYLDNGEIKTDLTSNSVKNITIEYDTLATEAELISGKAKNTVTISGPTSASDDGEVTLNSNTKAHVLKSGSPSYEIGDEKGYIYWTVTVYRDYGMNLNGYTLTDTMLDGASVVSAVDENGNNITDKLSGSGAALTFANDSNISKAVVTYKSPVASNTTSSVTNDVEVTPPGGSTPDDEKEITVTYDDTSLFTVEKTGSFIEDSTGGDNDYVEWTITVDASINNNSKENLNGYVITDEAFGKPGFEWVRAEAFNDHSKDYSITNASDAVSGGGTSYTVNKNIDKLILTYKLPLSSEEKAQRTSLGVGETMTLTNNVTVTPDDGGPKQDEGTVEVPGIAGIMSVSANKNWQGNDPDRPDSVQLQLQQRVDGTDEWVDYGAPVTVKDGETYNWDKLPKRNDNRKDYYYRVIEVNTPSGYTPGYSTDNGTNTDGAVITVTNTWDYINLGVSKSWHDINDEDKPVSVTFKLLQSTGNFVWTDTGKTITLELSDSFDNKTFNKLPKKDGQGNDLYYKIEEISAVDASGNNVVSDFTVTYNWLNGLKASDYSSYDPVIDATNTWNNLNVTVNKEWVGDLGYESQRPAITLTVWKKVGDGEWTATDNTVTIQNDGDSKYDMYTWKGLPKFENGQTVQYQVRETPVDNYYVEGESSTLTATGTINLRNNYSNMRVSASKKWVNDTPDSRPDTVTFRIQQSLEQWGSDDKWTDVPGKSDITVSKNADGSFDDAVWEGLPKKNQDGNDIYYRVIEVNISPDYTSSADKTYGLNGNGSYEITNTWNFINLTAQKQWNGDLGFEASRPDITLTLWKKVGSGEWTETDKAVVLKNNGSGSFYEEGDTSKPIDSYTWTKLPIMEGDQPVVYKIVETPVEGYDASYSAESAGTSGTITITNTSNHINVTGIKQWVGDNPESRPSTVILELWQSITPEDPASWTKVSGSDKTITKNSNGVFSNALWARIPGKDSEGHRIYYKIVEAAIQDSSGSSAADEYDATYSAPNGISETGSITVTNTWHYMNLSVSKEWSGFKEEELNALNINEIEVRLMQRIGESGSWKAVEGAETQKIIKSENGEWYLENAWEKLPRKDENGVDIYYRAEEITTGEQFNAKYDNGRNDTGTTVITNVPSRISVTARKVWEPENSIYSVKPDSIEFKLMQTIDGGATWTQVGDAKTLTKSDDYADVIWENLPTKDETTGYDIIYKVVEESVDGYSVSYSNETITETETVTVTNTERAPYTKRALYPTANKFAASESGITAIEEEYNFISEISPDQLSSLVKTIDGEEYYIFKWRLDFTKNQVNGDQSNMEYTITDTLPEGTILLDDDINYPQYCVAWRYNYGTVVTKPDRTDAYIYQGNTIKFNIPSNVAQMTYYTATLKSLIDEELAENGSYKLVNRVQEAKENAPTEATVSIKDSDTADYIKKTNNTAVGIDTNGNQFIKIDQDGNPVMTDGEAYYLLDINKDGRYLSSGSKVNISDVFQVLRYESEALDISGRNILDVALKKENVVVYEVDSNGNRKPLSAGEYSFSTKTEDGTVVSEKEFSSYSNNDINLTYNGLWFYTWAADVPKGLELVIQISGGKPNAELTVTGNENIKAEPVDAYYDSGGNAKIKVTFLKDCATGESIGSITINNLAGTQPTARNVLSSVVKQETEVTNYIINFAVPDGKHLQIEYQYDFKKTDNTDLAIGDFVTMQNSATIHTSGGDQTDDSSETRFVVQKSGGWVQSSGVPKIKKIDVGNESITDLNATFKLAKFDTESNKWIYATDFPFKETQNENGTVTVSKTDHTISFANAEAETDGTFPSSAVNLEVTNGAFNIVLEEDTLYKLIEIKAPDGFIKTPYELGITQLDEMKDFTYCFIYKKSDSINMSELKDAAGITDMQVQDVIDPGTVSIENIRPITIGVSKSWEQDPGAATKDVSVLVQLLSSKTKSDEIPDDAQPVANAKDYLVNSTDSSQPSDGTWILKKKLDPATGTYIWQDDEVWHNLPDGVDGSPLYYYVKEIAYSIDGKTYSLNEEGDYVDSEGNQYTDESGVAGEYKPTYADNGTNNDGIVSITNSREFVVKKQWLNRDGSIMKNPPSEYSEIEFTLKGIKEDGTEVNIALGENNKLSAANGWKIEIPQYLVSQYSKFKIQEVNAPYFYIVSDIYSLNGTVGVVSLINQSQEISEIDVSVDKIWGDGDDVHTAEDVTVTLYKYVGSRRFTNEEIKNFENTLPSGVTVVETIDPEHPITNPIKLDKDNDWSYTWTNLPYKENGTIVKYYAVETAGNASYVSSYEYTNNDSSQHMDITNSLPGAITIKKRWIDSEDGSVLTAGVPSEVKVEIYRQTVTEAVTTTTTTTTTTTASGGSQTSITQPIKIMALGDSITDGYSIAGAYRQYLYKELINTYGYKTESGASLIDMVGSKGWSGDKDYDDDNEGYSGYAIKHYSVQNRAGLYEEIVGNNTISTNKPDIILLMIGTNDILDNQMGTVDGGTENIKERLQSLVSYIYSQYSDPNDLTLFIANPTPLGAGAMTDYLYNSYNLDSAAKQKLFDDNIAKYSTYIQEIVDSEKSLGHDVVYVDVNSQLTLSDLRSDEIHPSEAGFEKMGKYFAQVINAHLNGQSVTTTTTTSNDVSSATTTTTTVNADNLELVKDAEDSGISKDGTVTLNAENGWSLSLINLPVSDGTNEYIYYVKEVNGEYYEVKYINNGQVPGSNQIITVENTTEGNPISITAEKEWVGVPEDSGITHPETVTLQLLAADTKDGTYSTFGDPVTVGEEQDWSYTWENLKGSKFYKVEETEIPDGWTVTYGNNSGIQTDKDVITVTNTLDTGSLELNKSWYNDNDGGTSEIEVEVWRITEDTLNAVEMLKSPMLMMSMPRLYAAAPRSNGVTVSYTETLNPGEAKTYINLVDVLGVGATITDITIESNYTGWGSDGVVAFGFESKDDAGDYATPNGGRRYDYDTKTTIDNIDYIVNASSPWLYIHTWDDSKIVSVVINYTIEVSETLEISPTTATAVAGDTLQIEAFTPIGDVNWSSSDDSIARVDGNGLVTALKAGTVTITANDDTATKTAEITVVPFTVNNDAASVQITEGETVSLNANNINGNVTWSSDNPEIASVDATGKVTAAGKSGTAVITADHGNGVTDTITIDVQSRALEFTAEKTLLHVGDTTASTVTPGDDVSYSVDKEGIVEISSDGTIKAVGNGDVTITALRGTSQAVLTIKVAPLTLTPTELEMSLNEIRTLTAENVIGTATWTSDNDSVVSVENGVITANGEGKAVITLKDGTSGLVTCEVTVVIREQTVELPPGAEQVTTVKINKADGWTNRLENLPLTDGNGHSYKYYIVEKSSSNGAYYPISYSQNGIGLKNDDITSLMITNKSTDKEVTEVIMPSAGGEGTTWYYIIGGALMLSSAAAYILIRRRKSAAE